MNDKDLKNWSLGIFHQVKSDSFEILSDSQIDNFLFFLLKYDSQWPTSQKLDWVLSFRRLLYSKTSEATGLIFLHQGLHQQQFLSKLGVYKKIDRLLFDFSSMRPFDGNMTVRLCPLPWLAISFFENPATGTSNSYAAIFENHRHYGFCTICLPNTKKDWEKMNTNGAKLYLANTG